MCATYHSHLTSFDVIIELPLARFSSSILGSNILLLTLFQKTLSLCSCLNVTDWFHIHIQQQASYNTAYFSRCIFRFHGARQQILYRMLTIVFFILRSVLVQTLMTAAI